MIGRMGERKQSIRKGDLAKKQSVLLCGRQIQQAVRHQAMG